MLNVHVCKIQGLLCYTSVKARY